MVKAQIHAGGRGKGGGVKVAKSLDEVKQFAGQHTGYDAGYALRLARRAKSCDGF